MESRTGASVRIFWASGVSKAGIALLAVLLILSAYTLLTFPPDYGRLVWNNPSAWQDNPKSAAPAWVNLFGGHKRFEHFAATSSSASYAVGADGTRQATFSFNLDFDAEEFPTFMTVKVSGVQFWGSPPYMTIGLKRPDAKAIDLYTELLPSPRPGEAAPYRRFFDAPYVIRLDSSPSVWRSVANFLTSEYGLSLGADEIGSRGPQGYLFGLPTSAGAPSPYPGRYSIYVSFTLYDPRDSVQAVTLILGGSLYGSLGTDIIGRDIATGIMLGFPVSLFVGVFTAVIVTSIGAALGVISGYLGGRWDEVTQRFSDVVFNVPLLPLTLFLIFVLGASIWNVVLLLVAFGWPGLTILVRSIALQIREMPFIEAARALGSSKLRIIFRHIFPQVAPYVVAQMIFSVPGFILLEAALSFLGLGDPSYPTWGQMLELGFRSGALYLGYWWWVIPPGVMIIVTALAFVLIALGLEPVVSPRLRRT